MKKAHRYIDKESRYVDYELPEGASAYEWDMDKEISCCWCGRKVAYGDCYTSRHIHTQSGFGYAECEQCYYGEHNEPGKHN